MREYQKGQILLLTVLVMVVAMSVGLSVAARTVTNLRTANEEDNSQRAFSAAEAGIEKTLTNKTANSGAFTNNASYQTTVSALTGVAFLLNNRSPVLKDDSADVWLSTYPTYTNPWSGTLKIYWGLSTDTCSASEGTNSLSALEIVLISGSKVNPILTHYAVDPCAARATNNNFQTPLPGGVINGQTLMYSTSIVVINGLIARIIPIYAPAVIGVTGSTALPSQGTIVQSTGKSNNTVRKISSFEGYPKLATELFQYSLFSPKP